MPDHAKCTGRKLVAGHVAAISKLITRYESTLPQVYWRTPLAYSHVANLLPAKGSKLAEWRPFFYFFFLPRSVLVAPAFLVVPVVSVIPILHLTLAFVVTLAILAASFSSFPSLPFRSKQQQALSDRPMQGARAHPPVVVAPELPARVSQ